MSRTSDRLAEDRASGGQRHLAVGGPGKDSHVVHLVVAQPRLRRGADVALPNVALRLLLQPHVRAQQRMHRNGASAVRPGVLTVAGQAAADGESMSAAARPPAARSGYSTEKSTAAPALCRSASEAAQPVRQLLLAPHGGQSGQRHVEASRGLLDGVGQQRVRGQLREDPVAVLQRRLHRRGEPHRVTQVVHPVTGIAHRLVARVVQGRRVVRHRAVSSG